MEYQKTEVFPLQEKENDLSMMRSLFSGVSGLKSHQTRMDVVGNNISNVNTVGYKTSRVTFIDTLNQTLTGASAPTGNRGGVNPKQIGLGAGIGSIDMIFGDGAPQTTGKNTDVCLSGSGLFMVKDGSGTYFTRNGAFEFDAAGNYGIPGTGMFVQGWTAEEGTVNVSGAPGNINIQAGKSMEPRQTELVSFRNNLNAADPTIVDITATKDDGTVSHPNDAIVNGKDPKSITLSMSDGTKRVITAISDVKYTKNHSIPITTTVTAYDSLGGAHAVPVLLERTAADTWQASLPKADYPIKEADGTTTTVKMANVTVKFQKDGSFDKANSGNGAMTLEYTNGANTGKLTVDFSDLSQYTMESTVKSDGDGYPAGTLKEVNVDTSGSIIGIYTNGVNRTEAQIAIAQFNNPSGLIKTGRSLYTKSNNSGEANIKPATALGCTITPSAIEMSNVDLSDEFSNMIVTQRGFQSNSKTITVSDEMLETLIQLKR